MSSATEPTMLAPAPDPPTTSDSEGVPAPSKPSALDPLKKKRIVTILLIGETGSGKTSFMSLLVNLLQGHSALELTEKHNESMESGLSKTESQTTKASLYTVITSDGTKIQILDTPGLADTRGIEQDNKHKAEINRAIKEFVTSIDAVIIMANGTVERLGAATDYTMNVVTSMFPYSIIDNIGFVFTNSDPLTWNFQMESLQPELRKSQYWLIQNPLALHKNYLKQVEAGAPDRTLKAFRRKLEDGYDETVETMNEWLGWLDARDTQPTKAINELYQKSVSIESYIEAALSALTRSHEQRVKWKNIQFNLENVEKRKGALEDLKKRQTEEVWEREGSDKPNTLCIASNCYSNCHAPCSLNFLNDPAELGRQCDAFPVLASGGDGALLKCRHCGHQAKMHRHYLFIHVKKARDMDPKTKKALDEATTEEQELEAAQNAAEEELKKIDSDITKNQDEIRRLVEEYNSVSLSRNFAGHIRSAIQMLQYRRKELESKPDTDAELKLIDESIAKFEQKLKVLGGPGAVNWVADKVKGVYRAVVG